MFKSGLNYYKELNIDSEGCIILLKPSNFFYNKKIKIIEKDFKFFQKQKQKKNLQEKKLIIELNFFKIINMTNKLIIENLKSLKNILPIEKLKISKYDLIVVVKPDVLIDILLFFKNHTLYQFKILTCISGVDYPTNKYRFEVVYDLLSTRFNYRIR